ncbi:uncharacterized protein LOC124164405 [Ischnura elegans]|uniref:uncharacterized protein LOC124164405 n=1 Tax=Ischnura elegans TaxID=197161 RepID=UPI001ED8A55C|nr:uncharacterized protein LOC124164405 [Ischnura elegans]
MVITFSHIICSHISTTYHSVFVSKASRRRALLEGGLVDSELHSLSVFLAMARKGLSHEELLAALQDISGNESGSDCGLGEDSDSSSDEEPFLLTNHSIPSSESDSDVPDTRLEDSSAPPQQDLRKNTIEHEKRKLLEGSMGRAVRGSRGRRGIGAVRRATSLRGHLKSRGSRGGYVMTTALDTTDSQMCLPREELTAANTLARQGPSQIEDDDNLCEASAKRKKCQSERLLHVWAVKVIDSLLRMHSS